VLFVRLSDSEVNCKKMKVEETRTSVAYDANVICVTERTLKMSTLTIAIAL